MRSLSSSDGSAPSWVKRLGPKANWIGLISYLAAIAYTVAVCWPEFNNKTYFSENALLPGLADDEFNHKIRISTYHKELKNHLSDRPNTYMPALWLKSEMMAVGLEAYIQDYTVDIPGTRLNGSNVYGIVRAPRGTNTEAIVVIVPFKKNAVAAVATLLAFANFCREQVYWAKDLIFIVVEHDTIGAKAWLSAYHENKQDAWLISNPLPTHAGAVVAALAVEASAQQFTHADIRYNMVNGQLPNLDMVNLVIKMTEKEGIVPTIFGREHPWDLQSYDGMKTMVGTAVSGLSTQALGVANGLHGVFGAYGIEAVTVAPYLKKRGKTSGGTAGWLEIARVMESTVRSVNNLLERFHQSFFYYFLPTTHRYVSIGVFMPAVGLLLFGPLFKAVMIWVDLTEKRNERSESQKPGEETKMTADDGKPKEMEEANHQAQTVEDDSVLGAMGYLLMAHLCGCLVMLVADRLFYADRLDWLFPAIVGVITAQLLLTPDLLLPNWCRSWSSMRMHPPSAQLLRTLALMELSLVVGVTSVLNFGLGLATGLLLVPVDTFVVGGLSTNRVVRYMSQVLLLMLHPLSVVAFLCWLSADGAPSSMALFRDVIVGALTRRDLLGDVLFVYVCQAVLPLWILFWTATQIGGHSL